MTQLEHALQTAARAEDAGAAPALVTAALLHDLGHLLNDQGETPTLRGVDDLHQFAALPFLRALFGDDVLAPIQLHVDAKRYLCATRADYYDALSADSKRSLALQGGIFTPEEAAAFIAQPYAADAVRVRLWDDLAKVAGAPRRRSRISSPTLEAAQRVARVQPARVDHAAERMPCRVELSLGVTLAVLGAGLLHAGWNALLKSRRRRRPAARHRDCRRRVVGRARSSLLPFVAAARSRAAWPFIAASSVDPFRLLRDAGAGVPHAATCRSPIR